ncbi:MAG: diguanylate cyclase [Proteobacteria bacterium]|nr:diguanylate cyclase [Pseudomonadota bacterium]
MSTTPFADQDAAPLWRQRLLLAASLFCACLVGIASRPAGYSAAIWPTNALLLGLLLRNPAWARSPATWLYALAAYLAADLVTNSHWLTTLGMNASNIVGVFAGWYYLRRQGPAILGFTRQRAVLFVLAGCGVAAMGSALPGAFVMQWAFAAQPWSAWVMWLSSELYDMVLFLPLVLAAPRGWIWQWNMAELLRPLRHASFTPLLALLASEVLAYVIDGPGMLGISVPAMVWCAMAYGVFPITILNLLMCSWKTAVVAMGGISFIPDQLSVVTSFRLGIALLSLAPLAVAVAHQLRSEALARLEQAVNHDDLTGALSRRTLIERGQRLVQRLHLQGAPVAVLLMDLDHFKNINDSHGHAQGDAVLREFAALVQRSLRPQDLFGRIGGEEFALILPGTAASHAWLIGERLRTQLRDYPFALPHGGTLQVTLSVGLHATQPPGPQDGLERLLACADAALYEAKAHGRDQVRGGLPDQG